MKKIYFACSIRGGRSEQQAYTQIVEIIKQHAELLTEIFADGKLTPMGSPGNVNDIYKQDVAWVSQADATIAEVTNPSLGVGYEIAKAEQLGKPILCLYRPSPSKSLSAMISGNPKVKIFNYTEIAQVKAAVTDFIARY